MSERSVARALTGALTLVFSNFVFAGTAVDGVAEAEFERRLKGFCTEWSYEIRNMTAESSKTVCGCLYDAASGKTSGEVKLAVNALPETAVATDFDQVYDESSMDRAVIDEITHSAVQCLADHGVPAVTR